MATASVNFNGPAAGTITTTFRLVNADANLEYMFFGSTVDTMFNDATQFAKFDNRDKKYVVTENICNGDTIQMVEVTHEWYETVLPITGRTTVKREIGRKVVAEKVFKFSAKKGASWK